MHISKVGIIGGASELGRAFARALARAGLGSVSSGQRQDCRSNLASDLCEERAAITIQEAADEEIVFLAIAWAEIPETLSLISDWEGRILIDATDPVLPNNQPVDLGWRTSSEVVCELAPGAQLVKAFNTLSPRLISADAQQFGGRRVVFFSGDHVRAKREVARLIGYLGFAGIDLGRLAEGGRLQQFPDGPVRGLNLLKLDEEHWMRSWGYCE